MRPLKHHLNEGITHTKSPMVELDFQDSLDRTAFGLTMLIHTYKVRFENIKEYSVFHTKG